jgi:redox-sensitive bicupin YhaK (pirin superfamily)
MKRAIKSITGHSRIDGVVPGIRGQRAFPNTELRTVDPFVMLDHIGAQNMGADYYVDGSNSAHPHRGFETVTFVFEGIMNHKDSLGNKEKLRSGSVQRMNAGSGIQHGGDFASDPKTHFFHEVQLWVNVPAKNKMSTPEIYNANAQEIPFISKDNGMIRVIGGDFNAVKGPIRTIQPTQLLHTISTKNQKFEIDDLHSNYNTLLYVLKGSIMINGQVIDEHYTVLFENDGDEFEFESLGESEVLIISGKPIQEPVVMGGPFVMNTTDEIDQAYADFRAGKFGVVK